VADLDDPQRLALIGRAYHEPTDDPVLDALLQRAITLASAPTAMVSIVGAHTQVFRAHRGLPAELAIACGTSRSISFCQLVVRSEDTLVVTDAATDPRVPQELVREYGIRAYAGAPIRRGLAVLGSLCVTDVLPRAFSETILAGLREIADQVSEHLEHESRRQQPAVIAGEEMTAGDLRARVESLLAALTIIQPAAQRSQILRGEEVTGEALASLRQRLVEALAFREEIARVARDMEAFVARFDRSDGLEAAHPPEIAPTANRAERLRRDVDSIVRTLGEVSVMARVADAFLRSELDAESAARALAVARDVLFATDALVRSSKSLLETLGAMSESRIEATTGRPVGGGAS
jgi:GAF domain-containing protein